MTLTPYKPPTLENAPAERVPVLVYGPCSEHPCDTVRRLDVAHVAATAHGELWWYGGRWLAPYGGRAVCVFRDLGEELAAAERAVARAAEGVTR